MKAKIYELSPPPAEQVELQERLTELIEIFAKIELIGKMSGKAGLSIDLLFKINSLFMSVYKVANPDLFPPK